MQPKPVSQGVESRTNDALGCRVLRTDPGHHPRSLSRRNDVHGCESRSPNAASHLPAVLPIRVKPHEPCDLALGYPYPSVTASPCVRLGQDDGPDDLTAVSRRIVSSPQPTASPNSFTDRYRSGFLWESMCSSLWIPPLSREAKPRTPANDLTVWAGQLPPFSSERAKLRKSTTGSRVRRTCKTRPELWW